jgi:regulator of sigma E protease
MIMTVIIFIIVLGVLIFVHELGHFLVAVFFGIRVDEFAIGFGPKLWSRVGAARNGTAVRYSFRAIPFGGYVKIYGENGVENANGNSVGSGAETMPVANSFAHKNRAIQVAVLFAGIFFNFLFAWIIVSAIFMIGAPVSPDSYPQYASHIHDTRIVVADVIAGSPAEKAGLKPGDIIHTVGNEPASGQTLSISEIQQTIEATAGKPISINGIVVTPVAGIAPADSGISAEQYVVGIDMESAGTLQLPPWSAVWEGAQFTIYIVQATAQGVWSLVTGLFQGNRALLSEVSGPVGIASLVGDAVHVGFVSLLMLVAVISVNLGVLNLVPFPALDGGRILFVIIESIIRRPIKIAVMNAVNTVGFAFLILLMIAVTYHDIASRL